MFLCVVVVVAVVVPVVLCRRSVNTPPSSLTKFTGFIGHLAYTAVLNAEPHSP